MQEKQPVSDIVNFSYDVKFVETEETLTDRQRNYLNIDRIHYMALDKSIIVCLLLNIIVLYILRRTIKKDIQFFKN